MIKKILLVASFKPQSLGSMYLKALRHTGYDPLCFDMKNENKKVYNRTNNPLINSIVNPYANRIINHRLLSLVNKFKPDMIMVQQDISIDPTIVDELKAKTKGQMHVFDDDFRAIEEMLLAQ